MAKVMDVLLSLPVVAVLLGVLTLAIVYLGRYWGLGVLTLALLGIPIVVAVVYLAWYRTLPYEPWSPRPAPAAPPPVTSAATDEAFEDPVEEADRFDQEAGEEEDETPVAVPDDDDSGPP